MGAKTAAGWRVGRVDLSPRFLESPSARREQLLIEAQGYQIGALLTFVGKKQATTERCSLVLDGWTAAYVSRLERSLSRQKIIQLFQAGIHVRQGQRHCRFSFGGKQKDPRDVVAAVTLLAQQRAYQIG